MSDIGIDPVARRGSERVPPEPGGAAFGGGAVGVDPRVVEAVARRRGGAR